MKGEKLKNIIPDDQPEDLETSFNLLADKSPYELFKLFFDSEMLELIMRETNSYAAQKLNHSFHVTKEDVETFLGIILLSGYHTLPQENLYWCTDEDVNVPLLSENMSRNRLKAIKRYLHVADNNNLTEGDKLAKVRPMMDLLRQNLQQFGFFCKELSLNEQMVPYYGHHSVKMYLKGKPIKFGYKIWILATSTGYPLDFDVCTGKNNSHDVPLGEKVVLKLIENIPEKSKHIICMDRYFSSTKLFRKMKDEYGLRCTGTAMENRIEN